MNSGNDVTKKCSGTEPRRDHCPRWRASRPHTRTTPSRSRRTTAMAEERLQGRRYGHRSVHAIRSRNTQVHFLPHEVHRRCKQVDRSTKLLTPEKQIPGSREPSLGPDTHPVPRDARAAYAVFLTIAALLSPASAGTGASANPSEQPGEDHPTQTVLSPTSIRPRHSPRATT